MLKLIFGAALALGCLATTAHAEFLTKYSQWHDLDSVNKSLYAAGLIDGGAVIYINHNETDDNIRVDGMLHCVLKNNLNGVLLAKMIDNAYDRDVSSWSLPPILVLKAEMEKLCRPELIESRKRLSH